MSRPKGKKTVKHSETIEKYDLWQHGDITREDYTTYIVESLTFFIQGRISAKHRTYGAEFEDLMQAGYLAIMEKIDEYDPRVTKPTTYFQPYIDEKTKDACNNNNASVMTRYYLAKAAEMEKAARDNGFDGINDPNLTPDTLAVLCGLPLTTVLEAIKCKGYTTVSFEAASDNRDLESPFITPERSILEKERKEFLLDQIECLSPLEQFLITETVMADKPKSLRKILEILKDPEVRKLYEKELPAKAEQTYLQQMINHALRRLKRTMKNNKIFEMPEVKGVDYVEQASNEDIEAAIIGNLLDI